MRDSRQSEGIACRRKMQMSHVDEALYSNLSRLWREHAASWNSLQLLRTGAFKMNLKISLQTAHGLLRRGPEVEDWAVPSRIDVSGDRSAEGVTMSIVARSLENLV